MGGGVALEALDGTLDVGFGTRLTRAVFELSQSSQSASDRTGQTFRERLVCPGKFFDRARVDRILSGERNGVARIRMADTCPLGRDFAFHVWQPTAESVADLEDTPVPGCLREHRRLQLHRFTIPVSGAANESRVAKWRGFRDEGCDYLGFKHALEPFRAHPA